MALPEQSAANELIPERPTLERLREAAAGCRACELHRDTTQTVFGDGASRSAGDGGSTRSRVASTSWPAARGSTPRSSRSSPRLRAEDDESREAAMVAFTDDLRSVARAIG